MGEVIARPEVRSLSTNKRRGYGCMTQLHIIISGVARGGFGGFNPIEKCQKNSEDEIVEDTQS